MQKFRTGPRGAVIIYVALLLFFIVLSLLLLVLVVRLGGFLPLIWISFLINAFLLGSLIVIWLGLVFKCSRSTWLPKFASYSCCHKGFLLKYILIPLNNRRNLERPFTPLRQERKKDKEHQPQNVNEKWRKNLMTK